MTDKDKLKAEIVNIRNGKKSILKLRQYPFFILTLMKVCDYLLSFIDSMQEEPVSDSETVEAQNKEVYMKPHSEPIYLGIGGIPINAPKCLCKEEHKECEYNKSDDFTKVLAECIHQAQGSVVDHMVFAELWKDELIKLSKCEEPVSEDLEEASKEWLRPQLDKSYVNYGEVKMMELTHFDGYAMLDAIEFGAKWQKAKDESTTEDLGEYINELSKQFPEVSFAKLSRIAVRVAKWQKEQIKKSMDLGEPPYLISAEQAYYRTVKLLED